eukprot:1088613-Rhodomonas_salina.2
MSCCFPSAGSVEISLWHATVSPRGLGLCCDSAWTRPQACDAAVILPTARSWRRVTCGKYTGLSGNRVIASVLHAISIAACVSAVRSFSRFLLLRLGLGPVVCRHLAVVAAHSRTVQPTATLPLSSSSSSAVRCLTFMHVPSRGNCAAAATKQDDAGKCTAAAADQQSASQGQTASLSAAASQPTDGKASDTPAPARVDALGLRCVLGGFDDGSIAVWVEQQPEGEWQLAFRVEEAHKGIVRAVLALEGPRSSSKGAAGSEEPRSQQSHCFVTASDDATVRNIALRWSAYWVKRRGEGWVGLERVWVRSWKRVSVAVTRCRETWKRRRGV